MAHSAGAGERAKKDPIPRSGMLSVQTTPWTPFADQPRTPPMPTPVRTADQSSQKKLGQFWQILPFLPYAPVRVPGRLCWRSAVQHPSVDCASQMQTPVGRSQRTSKPHALQAAPLMPHASAAVVSAIRQDVALRQHPVQRPFVRQTQCWALSQFSPVGQSPSTWHCGVEAGGGGGGGGGGNWVFFFPLPFFFLASVSVSPGRPSVPARSETSAPRRERASVSERGEYIEPIVVHG